MKKLDFITGYEPHNSNFMLFVIEKDNSYHN